MKTLIEIYLKDLLRNKMMGLMVILVPVIFYPLLYWGITQFIMIKNGFAENRDLTLHYKIENPEFSSLEDSIRSVSGIDASKTQQFKPDKNGLYINVSMFNDLPRYEVYLDSSNAFQMKAYSELEPKLSGFYETKINELIVRKNYKKEYFKVYKIEPVNIDGRNEIITKVLSLLIPLMSVISILASIAAASVELASGHSEDKTTETTLTLPLNRKDVIFAKFITVVIYGMLAGLISFTFIVVIMMHIFTSMIDKIGAGMADFDWSLIINFRNISLSLLSLTIIAFFVSMIFITAAGFASKRKEGNILVSPFSAIITYLPIVIVIPALEPNIFIAMTPVLNIAFALKLVIADDINTVFILETLVFSSLWAVLLYRFLFPFLLEEEVLLGYSNTSLTKKIKMKMSRWKKK